MNQISIKTTPNASEVWSGIGGHFDNLGQIINEFIDNSISNFECENNNPISRNILISIREKRTTIEVTIEDTGSGIKDLNAAFTLGCRSAAESPLNEHGFGLKHALASANPDNNCWSIYTRTLDDLNNNVFKKISAPYKFENFYAETLNSSEWRGNYNTTGTIINFECSYEMYKTLTKGIKGGLKDFKSIAALLYENIGFVYSGIIKSGKASISLQVINCNGEKKFYPVGAVEPDWIERIKPGEGKTTADLGDGDIEIEYHFGLIQAKDCNENYEFDNTKTKKYYRANMSSSGVEIRINGRVICYNLFSEIWNIEKHNSYNNFLVILNLKSNDLKKLPKTRTSKNGLRDGDNHLEKLFEWIRGFVSNPPRDAQFSEHETDLFDLLAKRKEKYNPDPNKIIETEYYAFSTTGNNKDRIRIDLFENTMGQISIYEGKKDQTTCKDVYQLRMYWDGLVYDGVKPDKAFLVASKHPQSVITIIQNVNMMKDFNGNNYNIDIKTWEDLNIM